MAKSLDNALRSKPVLKQVSYRVARTWVCLCLFFVAGPDTGAQQHGNAAQKGFDVASINIDNVGGNQIEVHQDPAGLRFRNVNLAFLISYAYEVPLGRIEGPLWIEKSRYDIAAKADRPITKEERTMMLRALLEERFRLQVHYESKTFSVYTLVVAKGGAKLRPAQSSSPVTAPTTVRWVGNAVQITGQAASLKALIAAISRFVDRPIVDQTGLNELFDFRISWIPGDTDVVPIPRFQRPESGADDVQLDANRSTVAEALEQQAGLRLTATRSPLTVLVVDAATTPSEN